MLDDFLVDALLAGTIVAVVAGAVGYVLLLRGETFAGHALSHIAFAGATGAVLTGTPPLWGLIGVGIVGGVGIGFVGEQIGQRDVAIGIVLTVALGFGVLFLHLFMAYATETTSLLFGNILGVDRETLWTLLGVGIVCLSALAPISRPLIFASLQPELAEARGVRTQFLSIIFLAIVGLAVASAAEVVGVLLVFALLVGPAAAAQQVTGRLALGLTLSVALAVGDTWIGLTLADLTDLPVSFWISLLSGAMYGLTATWRWRRAKPRVGTARTHLRSPQ